MTELTEAEIERLCDAHERVGIGPLLATVAAVIDARLAPIRALADEWPGVAATYSRDRVLEQYAPGLRMAAKELDEALSGPQDVPQPTSGTEGQGEGDEAGDGRWTHGDGRSCRRQDDGLWYVGLGIQCLRDHEENR